MMIEDQRQLENDQLKHAIKISLILHVFLFLSFSVQTYFSSSDEDILFEQAIRVDMIALPDKVLNNKTEPVSEVKVEKTEAAPIPVEKPEPKKVVEQKAPEQKTDEAINLNKTKSKQQAALEKLKQMSALEKIQNDLSKPTQNQDKTKVLYKGNVLAPGTALSGVNQLQADAYISQVHGHMISNWFLPEYLKNKDFRTDVLVKFDQNGNILSKQIVKSSGNQQFDEYVIAAIQKSSPVPAPPEKFMRISAVEGFLFKFRHD